MQIINLFDMGGYGVYVWSCYVILLFVIGWQILAALKRNIAVHKKIKDSVYFGTGSDKQT